LETAYKELHNKIEGGFHEKNCQRLFSSASTLIKDGYKKFLT